MSSTLRPFLHVVLLASAALSFIGCERNPLGREAISGSVQMNGAPLARGSIRFEPLTDAASAASSLTTAGGVIENGKFHIPEELGLPPGKYRVAISSPSVPPDFKPSMDTESTVKIEELVPAEYNTQSKLEAVVVAGEANAFDFQIVAGDVKKK